MFLSEIEDAQAGRSGRRAAAGSGSYQSRFTGRDRLAVEDTSLWTPEFGRLRLEGLNTRLDPLQRGLVVGLNPFTRLERIDPLLAETDEIGDQLIRVQARNQPVETDGHACCPGKRSLP